MEETEESHVKADETEAELRRLLADEKKKSEDYLTRLKYMQADLENFRKRSEKEAREVAEASVADLVTKLVPVLDELELAVHDENAEHNPEFVDGLKMVLKNLTSALEAAGLKRIESVGRPFDPSIHEAVEKVQGKSNGEDMVVEETRKGFTFRGRVVRPSSVKVELAMREKGKEADAVE